MGSCNCTGACRNGGGCPAGLKIGGPESPHWPGHPSRPGSVFWEVPRSPGIPKPVIPVPGPQPKPWIQPNPPGNNGWICPVCGTGVAPSQTTCPRCTSHITTTTIT